MSADNDRNKRARVTIAKYKKVFDSPDGRAVLFDLMKGNHVLSPAYMGDSSDALINEGRRQVILDIMRIIKMDPEKFSSLIQEEESHVS